ncbi:hypothetical protein Q3G72_008136 [Acer saccharum]|nr:hypothetical protein Q3G72_008136 [Acer saccharum]
MAPPIPGYDFCYSIFQDDAYTHTVSIALEKALKLKGKTGSYAIEHLDKSQAIILMMLLVLLVFSCCFTKSRQGKIISNCVLVKFAAVTTYKELDKLPRNSADFQADSIGSESLSSPFWVSSTIPGDWMWQLSSQFDGLSDQNIKCQIVCELEGDATVDGLYGIPV